jgi:flagellar biosynthetic protein FlhB
MAEPGRNLPPTKKKLDDARRRGEVAHFRDLACLASLAAGWMAVLWLVPGWARRFLTFTGGLLGAAGTVSTGVSPMAWIGAAGTMFLSAALTVAVPVLCLTVLAGVLTTGLVFSLKPVSAQLDRLNPLAGLRRMGSPERWFRLLLDCLRLGALAAAGAMLVTKVCKAAPAFAGTTTAFAAALAVRELLWDVFKYTMAALAPITALDALFTWHAHRRRMMMTREELKKEIRESEGDPSIKGRRQRLHREISQQRMLEEIRRATVVVVNPDHIAVALQWEETAMDAPTVVASGRDHVARQIIGEARRCGVPVVRDVKLARSLADLEPGEEIPEDLYEAVAGLIRLLQG